MIYASQDGNSFFAHVLSSMVKYFHTPLVGVRKRVIVFQEEPPTTSEIIRSGISILWVVLVMQIQMISLPEDIDDVVCFA